MTITPLSTLCRRGDSSGRLIDINFFRTSLARHEMKGGGDGVPSCSISTIYVIFFGPTKFISQFLRSSILGPETCPRYCCVDSVIRPFSNPHTPTMSLCPPRFWLCTFLVSILTSCSACPQPSLLLTLVAFHPRSMPLPSPCGSQASAYPSERCNFNYPPC